MMEKETEDRVQAVHAAGMENTEDSECAVDKDSDDEDAEGEEEDAHSHLDSTSNTAKSDVVDEQSSSSSEHESSSSEHESSLSEDESPLSNSIAKAQGSTVNTSGISAPEPCTMCKRKSLACIKVLKGKTKSCENCRLTKSRCTYDDAYIPKVRQPDSSRSSATATAEQTNTLLSEILHMQKRMLRSLRHIARNGPQGEADSNNEDEGDEDAAPAKKRRRTSSK